MSIYGGELPVIYRRPTGDQIQFLSSFYPMMLQQALYQAITYSEKKGKWKDRQVARGTSINKVSKVGKGPMANKSRRRV